MSSSSLLIVLTGATRGLGRALLKEFAALGHVVAGCGRDSAAIEQLRRKFPPPHRFANVDVADDIQVADWASHVIAKAGVPDLLINNAALMNQPAALWAIQAQEFDTLVDVNIKGVANVIRRFVPAMVNRGTGVIVNLSSGWGRSTSPGVAPYCASKWAIEGLTKSLAEDLPRGMAAVPLNPGIIDTDMLRHAWAGEAGQYEKPEEWARRAASQILKLGPRDSGKSLSIV